MKRAISLMMAFMLALGIGCAYGETTVNPMEERNVLLSPAGENETEAGFSPTTGLELATLDIPDGFAGLAVTGRYTPMIVQIDNSSPCRWVFSWPPDGVGTAPPSGAPPSAWCFSRSPASWACFFPSSFFRKAPSIGGTTNPENLNSNLNSPSANSNSTTRFPAASKSSSPSATSPPAPSRPSSTTSSPPASSPPRVRAFDALTPACPAGGRDGARSSSFGFCQTWAKRA